jgi:hypothetical protein
MGAKIKIRKDQVLLRGENAVIYQDDNGNVWRYLKQYGKQWPIIYVWKEPENGWDSL